MAHRADNKCERCGCLVVPLDYVSLLIDSLICNECWTDTDELNSNKEYALFTNTNFNNKFRDNN